MATVSVTAVVFDLGGVLIDWDPRHLYRKLMEDEAEMEAFLSQVCTSEWNVKQDSGRSFADGIVELVATHPELSALIEAYWERWPEMLGGAIEDAVQIVADLKGRGVPLYALSNWSAETWPHARERFEFLDWFDDLVISGFEGTAKPELEIFRRLVSRCALEPAKTLYFDDVAVNVAAARNVGLLAYQHLDPASTRDKIAEFGLL